MKKEMTTMTPRLDHDDSEFRFWAFGFEGLGLRVEKFRSFGFEVSA
jgi:hypothetical protein